MSLSRPRDRRHAASWFRTTLRAGASARQSRPGWRACRRRPWRTPRSPAPAFAASRLRSATAIAAAPVPGAPPLPARRPKPAALRPARSSRIAVRPDWRGCRAPLARRQHLPPPGQPALDNRRVDLNQEIAGLDALEIVHRDGQDLAGNAAAQAREVGADIGIVGGLGR